MNISLKSIPTLEQYIYTENHYTSDKRSENLFKATMRKIVEQNIRFLSLTLNDTYL